MAIKEIKITQTVGEQSNTVTLPKAMLPQFGELIKHLADYPSSTSGFLNFHGLEIEIVRG